MADTNELKLLVGFAQNYIAGRRAGFTETANDSRDAERLIERLANYKAATPPADAALDDARAQKPKPVAWVEVIGEEMRIEVEEKNAIIKSARIDMADRGILQAWLDLDYGGTCQGFGGYALYLPKSFDHHKLESVAGHFIFRCLEIAGAGDWNKLPGKTIRVRASHSGVQAIGHIVKNDWFYPAKDFAQLDTKEGRSNG